MGHSLCGWFQVDQPREDSRELSVQLVNRFKTPAGLECDRRRDGGDLANLLKQEVIDGIREMTDGGNDQRHAYAEIVSE